MTIENEPSMKVEKKKMMRIGSEKVDKLMETWNEIIEKAYECKTIFITKKKRVVARAKWRKGNLEVTKVRRPAQTDLKVGEILTLQSSCSSEIPPCPELKTDGWMLIRNKKYDSKRAKHQDPFWQNYRGWFIIPEKVGETDGLTALLQDYPEFTKDDCEVRLASEVDIKQLKMVKYSEVDSYVLGESDDVPLLRPFVEPKSEEMVKYLANFCFCGCGRFEFYARYWTNKWIVYEPRNEKK